MLQREDNKSQATRFSLDVGFKKDKVGFRFNSVIDNKNFTVQGDFYDVYFKLANTNDI